MSLVGLILIILAIAFFAPKVSKAEGNTALFSALYDSFLGIGSGLVATGLGTMLITFLLSDITETKENLDEWGIEGIFGERDSLKENELPKKQLDIAAFGLSHFRSSVRPSALEARIKEGLEVRLLIPNPKSEFIVEQQKQGGNNNLSSEIAHLIQWADKIKKHTQSGSSGFLEYKVYDSLPVGYYCRADNRIDVGPYMPGQKNTTTITYRYSAGEKGGMYFSDIFDKMWSEQLEIGITQQYDSWVPYNQKKAIEKCLAYFSNILQEGIDSKIVGIVAIFKNGMRRTFYSCNKDGMETHKSHGIEKGTIGVLRAQNGKEKQGKIFMFCDYEHGIEYEYANLRNKTITVRKVNHKKLGNNEECIAILAAPLVNNVEFIGALTFDFAHFPSKYNDSCLRLKDSIGYDQTYDVNTLDEIEETNLRITLCYVRWLFQNLINAGELMINMLGQYGESDYKKLYEEEWGNDD